MLYLWFSHLYLMTCHFSYDVSYQNLLCTLPMILCKILDEEEEEEAPAPLIADTKVPFHSNLARGI